jgi:hypothetical protein
MYCDGPDNGDGEFSFAFVIRFGFVRIEISDFSLGGLLMDARAMGMAMMSDVSITSSTIRSVRVRFKARLSSSRMNCRVGRIMGRGSYYRLLALDHDIAEQSSHVDFLQASLPQREEDVTDMGGNADALSREGSFRELIVNDGR